MVKKHLKIAIYSGEIPSTTFIERLIIGLSERNHTLYLFGSKSKRTTYKGSIKVIGYTQNRVRKFLHLIKYSLLLSLFRGAEKRRLDQILKDRSTNILYAKVKSYPVLWHRPDIFHIQWAKGLEEWSWVQDFGMKLILSLRGAHINYSPIANPKLAAMYKAYFPEVDGFHAVSQAIKDEAIIYGASADKIKVVYSGLNLDEFNFKSQKSNQVFQIISVGRPHWIKGYTYAIDACSLLKKLNLKFEYTIIGAANDIELQYQIYDLGLQDEIRLIGQTSFENVKNHIQSSDLLLLPSTKEGIANVVLEAMALNTLVLTTDCGGMSEVIQHGVNGFTVPKRNSKKMAEAILHIQQLTKTQKASLTSKAMTTLKEYHTETKMIDDVLELYSLTNTKNRIN